MAFAILAVHHPAHAQQAGKVYRIGILSNFPKSNTAIRPRIEAFRQGLRDLGYLEGRNVTFDYRYPETMSGREARLAKLAAELVELNPDVIFTFSSPAGDAAKNATRTIPIIFGVSVDRHVANFSRPGGNITGLSSISKDLIGKQLQTFRETVPGLNKVAVLWNPEHRSHAAVVERTKTAAAVLGLNLVAIDADSVAALPGAFERMIARKVQGVLILRGGMFVTLRPRISDIANRLGLPTMFGHPSEAEAGGLMAYGTNTGALFRRAASYVDKILKGAKPADLPVERPTRFDLVINLKTAKALGIKIPRAILLRADKVIE
jgi:putative ABC transport system substrate-binding protein